MSRPCEPPGCGEHLPPLNYVLARRATTYFLRVVLRRVVAFDLVVRRLGSTALVALAVAIAAVPKFSATSTAVRTTRSIAPFRDFVFVAIRQ